MAEQYKQDPSNTQSGICGEYRRQQHAEEQEPVYDREYDPQGLAAHHAIAQHTPQDLKNNHECP